MYKNYFFLNRLVLELAPQLKNFRIIEAYSQEKDKLVLNLQKGELQKHIEISVNSSSPYFLVKEKMNRAKRNTVAFFSDVLPAVIGDVLIAGNDRIIKIAGNNFALYFFIRGGDSNIFVENNAGVIFTFKDCEADLQKLIANDLSNAKYINSFYKPELNGFSAEHFEQYIKENYRSISKDIIREAKFRVSDEEENSLRKEIESVLDEIQLNPAAFFFNEDTKETLVAVSSFRSFPFTEKVEFPFLNDAIFYYLGKKRRLENIQSYKKIIDKYFKNQLSRHGSKLENLKNRINTPSREEEYSKNANLLLININKMFKGADTITIDDIYNEGEPLTIKLNSEISPKENIDAYFRKSKSERVNIEKSKKLYEATLKEFTKLKDYETRYINSKTTDEYELIMKELKIETYNGKGEKNSETKINFKQYIVDKKYNVYVGKDSANNDLLTTKFAKQNDYWFHARSVSGSHVVLRVENTKEAVPKNILKAAASLAAYHSKAKTSSMAPVSYTLKKYVYKKKGMDPGQVALTKEDVLLVKPEIPSICEFVNAE